MTPTTSEEISDLMQTLSSNKSTGPNSIPTSILKKIKNEISIPLSVIMNNSFENGIFPNLMKFAEVIPVLDLDYPATTRDQSLFYPTYVKLFKN